MKESKKIVLKTNDLAIGYFSFHILHNNLNLQAFESELIGLMGVNGSGKSTLLKTLAGMQKAVSGKIMVNNVDISPKNPKKISQQLSIVLTDKIDNVNLTVSDLVSMGCFPYSAWINKMNNEEKKIVNEAIEALRLQQLSSRYIYEISDGERQRVMIAKALTQNTPLILLDEPTVHLDIPNRIEILKLLKKLTKKKSKTIIFSSHELDMTLQIADTIWLLTKEGKMISDTPKKLMENGTLSDEFGLKKRTFFCF